MKKSKNDLNVSTWKCEQKVPKEEERDIKEGGRKQVKELSRKYKVHILEH